MNPALQKMIDKKKSEGKSMTPAHKTAKTHVLGDLMKHLSSMGMDKITQASKSKGLEKSIDTVQKNPVDAVEDSETSDHGANLDSETEEPEPVHTKVDTAAQEMSPEEILEENAALKEEIAKLKMGK